MVKIDNKTKWKKHLKRDVTGFFIIIIVLLIFLIIERLNNDQPEPELKVRDTVLKVEQPTTTIRQANQADKLIMDKGVCEKSCIIRTHNYGNGTISEICVPLKGTGICEGIDE